MAFVSGRISSVRRSPPFSLNYLPHDPRLPIYDFSSRFQRPRRPRVGQSVLPHLHRSLLILIFLPALTIDLSFFEAFRKLRFARHTVVAPWRITILCAIPRLFAAPRIDLHAARCHVSHKHLGVEFVLIIHTVDADLNAILGKFVSQYSEEHHRKSPIFEMAEFLKCGRGWPIVSGMAGN